MSLLADRVAVITGGSRGIGRGIAELYAKEGAAVAISGRNPSTGDEFCQALGPDRALFVQGDMTNRDDVERLIDATVERFGRLDIAVLNAGGVRQPAPIMKMTDEEWEYELNLNLNHTFWAIRRALPHMVKNGWGRILSISSVEGKHGKANVCGYVANKHAINGLTKSVAKEVGPLGITVNAICPGLVVTDMLYERGGAGLGLNSVEEVIALYSKETALGRPVTVDEVAATALFLASELGSGITGALVSVGRGYCRVLTRVASTPGVEDASGSWHRQCQLSAILSAQLPETGRTAGSSPDGLLDERPAHGTCGHSTIRDWADF